MTEQIKIRGAALHKKHGVFSAGVGRQKNVQFFIVGQEIVSWNDFPHIDNALKFAKGFNAVLGGFGQADTADWIAMETG